MSLTLTSEVYKSTHMDADQVYQGDSQLNILYNGASQVELRLMRCIEQEINRKTAKLNALGFLSLTTSLMG